MEQERARQLALDLSGRWSSIKELVTLVEELLLEEAKETEAIIQGQKDELIALRFENMQLRKKLK
tara:strand:- start:9072 stop:9266 length:195 start_codon:yes stop_codon:yes gene_type:complete